MNEVNISDVEIPGEKIEEQVVEKENELKEWLVNYVGEKEKPEDGQVTVGLIVETMAKEFPEFLLAVAEENWVRGYQQAIIDSEAGRQAMNEIIAGKEDGSE